MPTDTEILNALKALERAVWATAPSKPLPSPVQSFRPAKSEAGGAVNLLLNALVGATTASATINTNCGERAVVGVSWMVSGTPSYQHTLKVQLSWNGTDWYDVKSQVLSGDGSFVVDFMTAYFLRVYVQSTGTEGANTGYFIRAESWHGRAQ